MTVVVVTGGSAGVPAVRVLVSTGSTRAGAGGSSVSVRATPPTTTSSRFAATPPGRSAVTSVTTRPPVSAEAARVVAVRTTSVACTVMPALASTALACFVASWMVEPGTSGVPTACTPDSSIATSWPATLAPPMVSEASDVCLSPAVVTEASATTSRSSSTPPNTMRCTCVLADAVAMPLTGSTCSRDDGADVPASYAPVTAIAPPVAVPSATYWSARAVADPPPVVSGGVLVRGTVSSDPFPSPGYDASASGTCTTSEPALALTCPATVRARVPGSYGSASTPEDGDASRRALT